MAVSSKGGDIAVLGAGTAALLSALEAAKNGATVFLFPQGQELALDAPLLLADGVAAVATPEQRAYNIMLTPEQLAAEIKKNGAEINDPLLLQSFQDEVPGLKNYLETISGIPFNVLPWPQKFPYLHLPSFSEAGLRFREQLLEKIKRSPVIIRDEEVKEIVSLPTGGVEALLLKNSATGTTHLFYVQAVILAEGGCSGASAISEHGYGPQEENVNFYSNQQNLQNPGLRLALKQGAHLIQTNFFHYRPFLCTALDVGYSPHPLSSLPLQGTILFNQEGDFLEWQEVSSTEVNNFMRLAPGGEIFLIAYDDNAVLPAHYFSRFESLEEIMLACSLPDLQRSPLWLRKVSPYYLGRLKFVADYMLGGLAVTPQGEVKTERGVLKGLYAAGEIVGGLHGKAMLPGMALSETLFLAKATGEAAAAYARQ